MTGISVEDIENTLSANNVEPGSMLVRDGYYEYNIRIATLLRTPEDVKNIYIRKGERIMQLKELCKVDIVSQKEMGRSVAGGKRAVTLAIIKQSDENMDVMKEKLKVTTDYFASLYPDIEFSVSRNQTELLDYTISNLQSEPIFGFLVYLYCGRAVFGGCPFTVDYRYQHGYFYCNHILFLLFLSCVAECDITFGLDSGCRYDDRQRHYCNGKYFAVS